MSGGETSEDGEFEDGQFNDGEVITLSGVFAGATEGLRFDRALAETFPDLSRARLQGLIGEGRVRLDGRPPKSASVKVRAGQTVEVDVPPPAPDHPEPQNIPLTVLYEDEHLIVIDKAAGMAAHPAVGTPDGTLVNALLFHCAGSLSGIGGVARPGIVHRLDKETSGVMVAAKTDLAHQGLSDLFARHDIERAYLALTRGTPKPASGTLTTRIGRSPYDRKKMAVLKSGGREAITHYAVEQVFGRDAAARVRVQLETGRTHQIRVHLAHKGTPCLGDPVYGSGGLNAGLKAALEESGLKRQALHAAVLGFRHPADGRLLRFETPPPEDMQRLEALLSQI